MKKLLSSCLISLLLPAVTATAETVQIGTYIEFCEFANRINNGEQLDAVLTADITTGYDWWYASYNGIGSQTNSHPFTGTFDGQGHTISDFEGYSREVPDALFNYVKDATIKNLTVTVNINSESKMYAAGIVSYAVGETLTLENCNVRMEFTSKIVGDGSHGGLVAVSEATTCNITNCTVGGTMNLSGTYNNTTKDGNITSCCGGFVGYVKPNTTCNITNSILAVEFVEGDGATFARNNSGGGTVNITNGYYTEDIPIHATGCESQGTYVESTHVSQGGLAYELNGNATASNDLWRQNLDLEDATKDDVPYAGNTEYACSQHAIVYHHNASCNGNTEYYSNYTIATDHVFSGNVCTRCGYNKTGTVTITTLTQLRDFATNVNRGLCQDAVLADNLELASSWVGNNVTVGSETFPFTGTFDGKNYTITFQESSADQFPNHLFNYIEDATIKNLRITGTIMTAQTNAGLVQHITGMESHFENCYSDLVINSQVSGAAYHGSFASNNQSDNLYFNNCHNAGKMLLNSMSTYCSGFLGLTGANKNVRFTNCLSTCTFIDPANAQTDNNWANFSIGHAENLNFNNYCYVLTRAYDDEYNGKLTTEDELASGKICYLLNNSTTDGTQAWYQTLDTDSYPVLSKGSKTVYQGSVSGDDFYVNENGTLAALNIVDGYEFSSPVAFTVGTANYNRTMTNQWGTLCLPISLTVSAEDDAYDFYSLTSINAAADELTIEKVADGTLDAGTPVIVRRNTAESGITISETNASVCTQPAAGSTAGDLTLTGTYTTEDITGENGYFISNNAFWNIEDDRQVKVTPFRAWIKGTTANNARQLSLRFDDDDITAIGMLNAADDSEATAIYDLQGHRLSDLRQGVNIVKFSNGQTKKIIIK